MNVDDLLLLNQARAQTLHPPRPAPRFKARQPHEEGCGECHDCAGVRLISDNPFNHR